MLYINGEEEWDALPHYVFDVFLAIRYSPEPFEEEPSEAAVRAVVYDTDQERNQGNAYALVVAEALYWERRMAAFLVRHSGKSFRVFRPEDIERAITPDIEPLDLE